MSSFEDIPAIPKIEHDKDESFSSAEPSPEPTDESFLPESALLPKRKGGRKPIYATSEERKQRNRQAQAAFRERRTEYIKQLEATIKTHEDTLQNLQQSHRSAADECLMLRYKNSLLERILLEKGIDVQAELNSKTEGRSLEPSKAHPSEVLQPSPVQRAIMNRHNRARRSASGTGSKSSQGQVSKPNLLTSLSPQMLPLPSSQTSSPTATKSSGFSVQGGMISPRVGLQAQQQQQQHPPRRPRTTSSRGHSSLSIPTSVSGLQVMTPSTTGGSTSGVIDSTAGSMTSYYPSPFQTHIEQLEQEYAHAEMLDDQDPSDHSAGPGPYPHPFHQQPFPPGQPPSMTLDMQGQLPMQPPPMSQEAGGQRGLVYGGMQQIADPFDPMLDADPFGLTASMHFPTPFTFQESSMRQ
ncbi:hypothetical protein MMC12_003572 [Toensbergia leucococca]|nr:hypothetical protein [Toensbergia leucococca]